MPESTEVKVTRVEEQVKSIKEDLTVFRIDVMEQLKALANKLDQNHNFYATKEDLAEIRRIATTRLWQAVALTGILTALVTATMSYLIAKLVK